jgi:hypothetical protein
MSTNVEKRSGMVVLPPMAHADTTDEATASMRRWVWNPYRRIDHRSPTGLMRQIGAGGDHRYVEFERCAFYPLGNITWQEVDREALAERHLSGLGGSGKDPSFTFTKRAYDQAQELHESYGDTYGLRVFNPGLFSDTSWVDDHELVALIADTVQPEAFKLKDMAREFGTEAVRRIRESKELTKAGKELAEKFRVLMLAGSQLAVREGEREYAHLIQEMSNASVGKPGLSAPNDFHAWLCDQLGHALPERINTTPNQSGGDDTLKAAVNFLVQKEMKKSEVNEVAELKARLEALESKGKKKPQTEAEAA